MKEWSLSHPWMTFFIIIFTIGIASQNIFGLLRGKKDFMEKLNKKGGIKMTINKGTENGNSNSNNNTRQPIRIERGSQHVPPSQSGPPKPPPKQK